MSSDSIASTTAKPNNLPFSDHIVQSAISLERVLEYDNDRLIYPLIRLQRLGEEIYEIYQTEMSNTNQSRLHVHADRMMARLNEWRCSVPADIAPTGEGLSRHETSRCSNKKL
jgi:hypothetical protein